MRTFRRHRAQPAAPAVRNAVATASGQHSPAHRAQHLARAMNPAPRAQLVAVYQPVVDLATHQLVAAEALTRFLGSAQSPEQWFDQATRDGTGPALETAAAAAALRGLRELPPTLPLALNFSPDALIHSTVTALLLPHAPRLIVEVTEREQIHDFDRLADALAPLRAAGALLAADDVGAGYADLDHVSQLKPDILKIDRAIVAGILDNHVCRAFAAAVTGFAEDIGMRVTAEGIETPEQLDELRSLGVAHGQGYLLGRPDSPAAIAGRHRRAQGCTAHGPVPRPFQGVHAQPV